MSSRLFTRMHRKLNFASLLTSTTTTAEYGSYRHEALDWHKSNLHHKLKYKHKHKNGTNSRLAKGGTIVDAHPISPLEAKHSPSGSHLTPSSTTTETPEAVDHFAFDVVSFNLLAPVYKRLTTKNAQTGRRHREAGSFELWTERLQQTVDFFKQEIYTNAAIIALQEYWLDVRYRKVFEEQFAEYGYDFRIMQRAGTKVDAVALVVKKDLFEIKGAEYIDLATLGDRVALLLWLKHKLSGHDLLVANTHLSFPHNPTDQRHQVMQMKHLTSVIDRYAQAHNITGAPSLIMGDFNVEGRSMVCDHLRSAGYYSCFEVSPPANCPVSEFSVAHPQDTFVRRGSSSASTADSTIFTATTTTTTRTTFSAAVTTKTTTVSGAPQTEADIAQFPPSSERDPPTHRQIGRPAVVENVAEGTRACDDIGDNCVDAHTVTDPSASLLRDNESAATPLTSSGNPGPGASFSDFSFLYPDSTAAMENTEFRSVTYVSHFNHRSEEVGVDHIFIKPTSATFAGENNPTAGFGNREDSSETFKDPFVEKGAALVCADPAAESTKRDSSFSAAEASTAAADANKPAAAQDLPQVFVAECQVLPVSVSCTSWYKQFRISDHRPVRTRIVLAKPESKPGTEDA